MAGVLVAINKITTLKEIIKLKWNLNLILKPLHVYN